MSARRISPAAIALISGIASIEAAADSKASSQWCSEAQLCERIAVNVLRLRLQKALSARELAERAHLHLRHMQKIEAGLLPITLGTLGKLGVALEVDPPLLLKNPSFEWDVLRRWAEKGGLSKAGVAAKRTLPPRVPRRTRKDKGQDDIRTSPRG